MEVTETALARCLVTQAKSLAYGLGCPQPNAKLRGVVHLRATDGGELEGYSDLVAGERREIRSFGL